MRACVMRVLSASVSVAGQVVGEIDEGMLVLLAVAAEDTPDQARGMADKLVRLRIFDDEAGKLNRSLLDMGGAMLLVSQFTLLGDCSRGRRPSFARAAPPAQAEQLYRRVASTVTELGVRVATGQFRQHMQVRLLNDGPVTVIVDV